MFKMFDGLALLMKDNDDRKRSIEERVKIWSSKTESQIEEEITLLSYAKAAWFFCSVLGWNIIALTGLGFVVNKIWENDFQMTLLRLFIVVGSWVTLLFVVWRVASMFDKHAGFERWQKAFLSREDISEASLQDLENVKNIAFGLPGSGYKYLDQIRLSRKLRREDWEIMLELERQEKIKQFQTHYLPEHG